MKKSTLWTLCLVALVAGLGYDFFSRPTVVVSVVVIGLPFVLAAWAGLVGEE